MLINLSVQSGDYFIGQKNLSSSFSTLPHPLHKVFLFVELNFSVLIQIKGLIYKFIVILLTQCHSFIKDGHGLIEEIKGALIDLIVDLGFVLLQLINIGLVKYLLPASTRSR